MTDCDLQDGHCLLKNGDSLIWEVPKQMRCPFIPFKKAFGIKNSNTWIDNEGQLALTFDYTQHGTDEYQRELTISDQGFAIYRAQYEQYFASKRQQNKRRSQRKARRSTLNAQYAYATVEQLASQLTALKLGVDQLTTHSARQMCRQQHPNWAISNTDPTMLARQLLHTDYVHATWAANDTLAICHCAKVPWEELGIMKTEICYDQAKLLFHNKTFHLNSRTNVLETSANQIQFPVVHFSSRRTDSSFNWIKKPQS